MTYRKWFPGFLLLFACGVLFVLLIHNLDSLQQQHYQHSHSLEQVDRMIINLDSQDLSSFDSFFISKELLANDSDLVSVETFPVIDPKAWSPICPEQLPLEIDHGPPNIKAL